MNDVYIVPMKLSLCITISLFHLTTQTINHTISHLIVFNMSKYKLKNFTVIDLTNQCSITVSIKSLSNSLNRKLNSLCMRHQRNLQWDDNTIKISEEFEAMCTNGIFRMCHYYFNERCRSYYKSERLYILSLYRKPTETVEAIHHHSLNSVTLIAVNSEGDKITSSATINSDKANQFFTGFSEVIDSIVGPESSDGDYVKYHPENPPLAIKVSLVYKDDVERDTFAYRLKIEGAQRNAIRFFNDSIKEIGKDKGTDRLIDYQDQDCIYSNIFENDHCVMTPKPELDRGTAVVHDISSSDSDSDDIDHVSATDSDEDSDGIQTKQCKHPSETESQFIQEEEDEYSVEEDVEVEDISYSHKDVESDEELIKEVENELGRTIPMCRVALKIKLRKELMKLGSIDEDSNIANNETLRDKQKEILADGIAVMDKEERERIRIEKSIIAGKAYRADKKENDDKILKEIEAKRAIKEKETKPARKKAFKEVMELEDNIATALAELEEHQLWKKHTNGVGSGTIDMEQLRVQEIKDAINEDVEEAKDKVICNQQQNKKRKNTVPLNFRKSNGKLLDNTKKPKTVYYGGLRVVPPTQNKTVQAPLKKIPAPQLNKKVKFT